MNQDVQSDIRELLLGQDGVPADHGRDVDRFYAETVPALAERGLFGLLIPQAYGGRGYTVEQYVEAIEEIAAHDMMSAYSVNEHSTIGTLGLVQHGSEQQKSELLPGLASGDVLAAFCLTEPASGSDITSLGTQAEQRDGGYVLTGKKIHISLAHHARLFTVLAQVKGPEGSAPKAAFLVSRNTPGLSNGPENSSPPGYLIPVAGSVVLDGCEVADSDVLGTVGAGGRIFKQALETARVGLAAAYVGNGRDALSRTVGRVVERRSFGQRVADHQMVQSKIADMHVAVEAGRQLVRHAARVIDTEPESATAVCAAAKVFVTEAAQRIGADAVQLFGGAAFLVEPPVDWYLRDAKMGDILGGTSEVMRLLIAKDVIGKHTLAVEAGV